MPYPNLLPRDRRRDRLHLLVYLLELGILLWLRRSDCVVVDHQSDVVCDRYHQLFHFISFPQSLHDLHISLLPCVVLARHDFLEDCSQLASHVIVSVKDLL